MSLVAIRAGQHARELSEEQAAYRIQKLWRLRKEVFQEERKETVAAIAELDIDERPVEHVAFPKDVVKMLQYWDESKHRYLELGVYAVFLVFLFTILTMQRDAQRTQEADQALSSWSQGVISQAESWEDVYDSVDSLLTELGGSEDVAQTRGPPTLFVKDHFILAGGAFALTQTRLHVGACGNDEYDSYQHLCRTTTSDTSLYEWHPDGTDIDSFDFSACVIGELEDECKMVISGMLLEPEIGAYGIAFAPTYEKLEVMLARVDELRQEEWLDHHTANVQLLLLFLNREMGDMWTSLKVHFMGTAAGVEMLVEAETVRPRMYVTAEDKGRLAMELMWCMGLLAYIVKFLRALWPTPKLHQLDFWVFLEGVTLIFHFVMVIQYATLIAKMQDQVVPPNNGSIHEMHTWAHFIFEVEKRWQSYFSLAFFTIFLCFLRIFHFLKFQKRLSLLTDTLAAAGIDLLHFGVMSTFVLFAFCLMGNLLLGVYSESFSTVDRAAIALVKWSAGDFSEYTNVRERLGPMADFYFLIFQLAIVYLLLNMFLAIIFDAYGGVKASSDEAPAVTTDMKFLFDQLRRKVVTKAKERKKGRVSPGDEDPEEGGDQKRKEGLRTCETNIPDPEQFLRVFAKSKGEDLNKPMTQKEFLLLYGHKLAADPLEYMFDKVSKELPQEDERTNDKLTLIFRAVRANQKKLDRRLDEVCQMIEEIRPPLNPPRGSLPRLNDSSGTGPAGRE